jgi:hypothetical protein
MKVCVYTGALSFFWVLSCAVTAYADDTYVPVSSSLSQFHSGYEDVYNSSQGIAYGKAEIQWNYWYNPSEDNWSYAYKVYNNQAGAPNDRTDDYHFGTFYNSGSANAITSFGLNFKTDITTDLISVTSTMAGSSEAGAAWGSNFKIGSSCTTLAWSTLPGSGSIAPTQWDWEKVGSTFKWVQNYAGDTSNDDSSGNYFEFTSKWAPGLISGYVYDGSVYSDSVALGNIYGPAFVPEPLSLSLVGIGICLVLRRRNRNF